MTPAETELTNFATSIFCESGYYCRRHKKGNSGFMNGWYLYHEPSKYDDRYPFYLGKNKESAKKALLDKLSRNFSRKV
jgi:hypothetical protein